MEKIKKYSGEVTDHAMKPHNDYRLYNLIKNQVPRNAYGRNLSVQHARLNVTLPEDQGSAVSLLTSGRVMSKRDGCLDKELHRDNSFYVKRLFVWPNFSAIDISGK